MNIVPSYQINEKTSPELRFVAADPEGSTDLQINSVKVFLYVEGTGEPPLYINGRDGTDDTGLSFAENDDGTWTISFHMVALDNAIINKNLYAKTGWERHTVIFEINYGSGDIFYQEIELLVKDLPIVA